MNNVTKLWQWEAISMQTDQSIEFDFIPATSVWGVAKIYQQWEGVFSSSIMNEIKFVVKLFAFFLLMVRLYTLHIDLIVILTMWVSWAQVC